MTSAARSPSLSYGTDHCRMDRAQTAGEACIVCWDEPIKVARRVEGAASWISEGDRLAAHVVHL